LAHFKPRLIVRFVKVFGFAAACRRAGIEIRQLVGSVSDGEPERIPVIHRGSGVESGSEPYENVSVSVVIPVKDAGEEFRPLLSSLMMQKGFAQ
jgi:hypothetical protein